MIMVIGIFSLHQLDYYYDLAKDISENASASGVLFTEKVAMSKNETIYIASEVNKSVRNTIDTFLNINNLQYTSEYNKYFNEDEVNYSFFLINSDNQLHQYDNGVYIKTSNITFPYKFTDPQINYSEIIYKPTVVVTIDLGTLENYYFNTKIIRSSAYIKTKSGE